MELEHLLSVLGDTLYQQIVTVIQEAVFAAGLMNYSVWHI